MNSDTTNINTSICQKTLVIEKEYINSMLDIASDDTGNFEFDDEPIDFNEAYKCDSIECAVFTISGISFGIPLAIVDSVSNKKELETGFVNNDTTNLSLSTAENNGVTYEVVDLSDLIMNRVSEKTNNKENIVSNLLLLKGCSTGIVFNELLGNKIIQRNQVKWREGNSGRLWLAGTLSEYKISLLDVEQIINLIQDNKV